MTSPVEYASALKEAERELASAATAEDVRRMWRKHFGAPDEANENNGGWRRPASTGRKGIEMTDRMDSGSHGRY